jgi:hypothetical protein
MASVIDTFLVAVGLDVSAYNSGMKSAEGSLKKFGENNDAQKKRLDEQSKAMAAGFNKVKQELIGLVAVAMGAKGVKEFFSNMITGQAALGRVANNLGMSAKSLDAWGAAAESVGGSADGMRASMQAMQSGFEAFKLGENSPVVNAFQALKVRITDTNGKIRPMRDLMLDLSAAMKGQSAQDQIRIARDLGLDDGTLNLLRMGRDDVSSVVDQMERASKVSDESTANAAKAQASWNRLKHELMGVGQAIFDYTIPAITKATDSLADNISAMMTWFQKYSSIKDMFKDLKAGTAGAKPGEKPKSFWEWMVTPLKGTENYGGGPVGGSGKSGLASSPLAALISRGEGGYNSVNRGAAGGYKSGTENLENMTVAEVMAAQKSGKFNAAGKYQVIAGTLPEAVKAMGLTGSEKFDRTTQDKIFEQHLAGSKRPAISDYLNGKSNDLMAALKAMSQEWASIADPSTGRSFYSGSANNRASITSDEAAKALQQTRQMLMAGQAGGGASTRIETNIGTMNVVTKATDSAGIARDMQGAIQQQSRMSYAANGMN